MGNCINHLFSPSKKAQVLIYNQGKKESRASKLVKEVAFSTEPGHGEAGYLVPHLMKPTRHSISLEIITKDSCQGRTIKIMVTRQQLEFLLRDAKMFQSMKTATRPSRIRKPGNQKWQPSLSAIPEVLGF